MERDHLRCFKEVEDAKTWRIRSMVFGEKVQPLRSRDEISATDLKYCKSQHEVFPTGRDTSRKSTRAWTQGVGFFADFSMVKRREEGTRGKIKKGKKKNRRKEKKKESKKKERKKKEKRTGFWQAT